MPQSYSMTLKRTAASKRASLPRAADYTKSFLKDWERLSRSGRYDRNRLKEAMLLLVANDAPLGPEWLDHSLTGSGLVSQGLTYFKFHFLRRPSGINMLDVSVLFCVSPAINRMRFACLAKSPL